MRTVGTGYIRHYGMHIKYPLYRRRSVCCVLVRIVCRMQRVAMCVCECGWWKVRSSRTHIEMGKKKNEVENKTRKRNARAKCDTRSEQAAML